MKQGRNVFRYRLAMVMVGLLLLGLMACRFDIQQEVRFAKDLSGTASITINARDLIFDTDEEAAQALETNALQKYVDLINNTPGAKLTESKITDLSYGEGLSYEYLVQFSFDTPATLNRILASEDSLAVKAVKSGKTTTLTFYPAGMSLLDQAELESQIGSLKDAEINFYLKLHAPSKLKDSSAFDFEPDDENSREWTIPMDEAWFASPGGEFFIKF